MASSALVGVTGASGFVGGQITADLLKNGYRVRVFVRDVTNTDKIGHLKLLEGNERLEFGQIEDLLSPPADLADRFCGCTYIIHCASPVPVLKEVKDAELEVVLPAVNGTKSVLEAALKAGVKRVVITASMASVCGTQRQKNPNHVWTEEDWNDEMKSPYSRSKVLAEKAAWEFVAAHPQLELATIQPTFVLGPLLHLKTASTAQLFIQLLEGKFVDGAGSDVFGICNVMDVSAVHLKAMVEPKAAGQRYLVCSVEQHSMLTIADIVREVLPEIVGEEKAKKYLPLLPTQYKNEPCNLLAVSSDCSKVTRDLGIVLSSAKETISQQIASLFQVGVFE
jgi:dihydroflavonol-4-reductase